MITALLLAATLATSPCNSVVPAEACDATVLAHPIGGPPAIRVAGKAKGDITRAEWETARTVELVGCVPDARIVSLTVCINDCTAKGDVLRTTDATPTEAMRKMIAGLPAGKTFTVKVEVKDAKGQAWDVAPARYVWKG